MPGPCPTPDRLAASLRERQPAEADAELTAHLADCPACQAQIEALAGGSGWLEAKAKTHSATGSTAPEPLRQAMDALESRSSDAPPSDAPTRPELDFLQPSDQPGVLGRFGPYEVLAHVASGGMGIVLKARDPALDRIVALKILPPTLAANALARARFVREARAAAAVVHEHVVPIYAVDECAGLPYLVMQFVQGRTLAERIRASGPLRLEEILRIGAQTAAGLAAAHAQGLIHRDVKPGNILLENSVERVKLTDFGLARAVDDAGLTRTGELAGTPEFMAPEQAGNEAVDHRSDLFSFGSVLYAMCTGCSPFQGNSVVAVIRKVCDEAPPPVHDLNPAMPRWLSDIVARLMAKLPAERFQSAKEVGELLERYLARVQHGELSPLPDHRIRAEPTRHRRSLSYAVGAVAMLAALGLLVFALKGRRASSPAAGSQAASQTAFAVRNQAGKILGSYTDLAEAARVAPPVGVIECRWNGEREMPPVMLPAKPLTLRAGEGFNPVWVHTDPSQSALAANSTFSVEGLTFAWRRTGPGGQSPGGARAPSGGPRRFVPSGIGLISISNAPLRLSRCVLQVQPRYLGPPAGLAALVLDNATACELESTALFGTPRTAILWRQTARPGAAIADGGNETRLSLSNCVVTGLPALQIELAQDSRARLEMLRCTFEGPGLIYLPETSASRAITVNARSNVFKTGIVLRDVRNVSRDELTASMHWQGSDNLFHPGKSYIVIGPGSGESRQSTLAQWNRWWPEPETRSREISVTFAGPQNEPAAANNPALSRTAYRITKLDVIDGGPPLPEDQWPRYGADTANVGPAASR